MSTRKNPLLFRLHRNKGTLKVIFHSVGQHRKSVSTSQGHLVCEGREDYCLPRCLGRYPCPNSVFLPPAFISMLGESGIWIASFVSCPFNKGIFCPGKPGFPHVLELHLVSQCCPQWFTTQSSFRLKEVACHCATGQRGSPWLFAEGCYQLLDLGVSSRDPPCL